MIVDALLGTGIDRDLNPLLSALVKRINQSPAIRVSVDIPSGLNSDTGATCGRAVAAHYTVTFGLAKVGLIGHPGVENVGELEVADISIPRQVSELAPAAANLLETKHVAEILPRRPSGGHKGTFGHLLVIAGSLGKTGAALLCGEAAMRCGVGLCTLAAPAAVAQRIERRVKETMVAALPAHVSAALDDSPGGATLGKGSLAR